MEKLKAVCEKFRSHLQNINIMFIVVFALFFHLNLVSSRCGGPGSSFFETHPKDVSIVEGGNAAFVCTVMRFDPNTETLSWHVFPDKYHTVILDFYDEPSQNKTSEIIVYDVGRNEQTFKCILRGLYHGYIFETCSSQVSTMHVQYFPRGNEITCGPNPLGELYDESRVAVWCMVQEGNPSVHLSWETKGLNLSFTELYLEVEGNRMILNQTLHVNSYLHLKTLYCVTSSDARIFRDEEITCLIGPLLVRHKPQVKIFSTEMLDVGDINARKIELNCAATSYPENKTYNWLCSPEDILIGCHNVTSKTILLGAKNNNTSINDIDFEVSCSVTNAEGTTTDVFSLSPNSYRKANGSRVMDTTTAGSEIHVSDIGLCQSVTPRLNLLNKSVNWEMFSFEVHMVCFPDCIETAGTNVFISWLVNENKIEPDSNNILRSLPPPTSSVTAKGYFKEFDIINVTCEIRSHNVTYRNSVNISFAKPPYVTAHINKQLITHPWHTEKGQTEIEQGDWFKLNGIQVIIFTSVAVLVGLLLTACICAFCTVCIFKYLQQANSIDTNRCQEQKSSTDCASFHVSQQNSCLDQSIMSISNEDAMYEQPVTPPPSPPLASPNVAYKDNHVREGVHFFEKVSSQSLSVIYDCTNSITSSICSNTSSDISVPSGYSEWSGQMPSELQEDVDLGNITCTSREHVYDNAGIIRMHMFPRSASLSRLPRQNDLNETEFPPPALPGSGAKDSSRL